MRKLIWLKLFFAFATLPMWARCGFQTDQLKLSTFPITAIPYIDSNNNLSAEPSHLCWDEATLTLKIGCQNYPFGEFFPYGGTQGGFQITDAGDPYVGSITYKGGWGDQSLNFHSLLAPWAEPYLEYTGGSFILNPAAGFYDGPSLLMWSNPPAFDTTNLSQIAFAFNSSYATVLARIYAQPSNVTAASLSGKLISEVVSLTTTTTALVIDGDARLTTSSFPVIAPYFKPSTASAYINGQMLFGVTATGALNVSTMSGTTNQITVTASTFNITLSLPQNINTSATPQFGQMGLGTPGGTTQRLKIVAGSVNQCAINIAPGTLKTTPVAGDIDNATDDIYYTIQTGAARKNFVLSDSALTTGGHIPYTTTNGRLVDTSFLTYVGTRLALSAGSSGGAISLSAGGRPNPAVAGDIWIDTTTTKVRAVVDSSTETFVMAEATQTLTGSINVSSINVISSGKLFSGGALVGLVVSTYSDSGTFNFGTTTNTIAIANSSSTITLTSSGTYRIDGMANMRYNGATFAANQFVTLNLYRQNNTPGVITNSQSQEETQISVSGLTSQFGQFNLPPIFYTTTNTNDIISLHGSISATPGAGNFQATEASLVAQRLY